MTPGSVAIYVDEDGIPHSASILYAHRTCLDIVYGKRTIKKSVPFYKDGMKGGYISPPPVDAEPINMDIEDQPSLGESEESDIDGMGPLLRGMQERL
jgi:hypothetical protein